MSLEELKKELLKNPKFKKEWEKFDLWFELQELWTDFRVWFNKTLLNI